MNRADEFLVSIVAGAFAMLVIFLCMHYLDVIDLNSRKQDNELVPFVLITQAIQDCEAFGGLYGYRIVDEYRAKRVIAVCASGLEAEYVYGT